jgi:hypothetical protein
MKKISLGLKFGIIFPMTGEALAPAMAAAKKRKMGVAVMLCFVLILDSAAQDITLSQSADVACGGRACGACLSQYLAWVAWADAANSYCGSSEAKMPEKSGLTQRWRVVCHIYYRRLLLYTKSDKEHLENTNW